MQLPDDEVICPGCAHHFHAVSQTSRDRIASLEEALRAVVRDVNDYEDINKLSPNPGRSECWDSVARAKAVLATV